MDKSNKKCPECGHEVEINRKVVDNKVEEDGLYCPECKREYQEGRTLQWNDLDFPLWIEHEVNYGNYELLRTFYHQTGLYRGNQNGTPDLKDFKYTIFTVWFKVEKDGTVKGPYENRGDTKTI